MRFYCLWRHLMLKHNNFTTTSVLKKYNFNVMIYIPFMTVKDKIVYDRSIHPSIKFVNSMWPPMSVGKYHEDYLYFQPLEQFFFLKWFPFVSINCGRKLGQPEKTHTDTYKLHTKKTSYWGTKTQDIIALRLHYYLINLCLTVLTEKKLLLIFRPLFMLNIINNYFIIH